MFLQGNYIFCKYCKRSTKKLKVTWGVNASYIQDLFRTVKQIPMQCFDLRKMLFGQR